VLGVSAGALRNVEKGRLSGGFFYGG